MVGCSQQNPIAPVVTTDTPPSVRKRDTAATLISVVVHVCLLLLFALWAFPSLAGQGRQVIQLAFDNSESFSMDATSLSADIEVPATETFESPTEIPDLLDTTDIGFTLTDPITPEAIGPTTSTNTPQFSVESLASSSSVEGAVDRITGELSSKLQKDDLLVIWLLDASGSLVDDRQRIAARLTPFYQDIVQKRSSMKHVLKSAVVSYGAKMRERVAPTEFGEKIIAAVQDLPVDRTGNEKVFDAVAKCAANYRASWTKQCVIVIWTDESGDDVAALPNAIEVCRDNRVTVSVVGPSSVLGADTGLHSYTDPKTNCVYQLPVRRGPDTPVPERLELGYWYPTRFGGGRRFGRQFGRPRGLPSWLGGQDLEGILSGFSPYALTRLATQTGGAYTIFDRPEDRGPFDPTAMSQYAPSYGSMEEYQADVRDNPIRRAVMNANRELRGKKIDSPPMMLFVKSTGDRHFDFMRFYYTPNQFLSKLKTSRGRLKGQATRSAKVIDKALRHLSTDTGLETGLEDQYRYEKSARWRAWYDLTRGRLLANSARLEEYRLIIDDLIEPGSLKSDTNHVILVASPKIRASSKYRKRAEEAEQLLRRCVEQNRGTPWETLAQRELDFAIGIAAQERALTPTGGGPSTSRPSLPRF